MNCAAALKCNGYGMEPLLAGYLEKGSIHKRGLVCECTGLCTLGASVHCGGVNFFNLSLKLIN